MEDWKPDAMVVSSVIGDLVDRSWSQADFHMTSFHDPSQPWKPAPEGDVRTVFGSTGDGRPADVHKTTARRMSLDEAEDKSYLRHLSTHEATATTLIERETCSDHVIKVWNEISKFIVDKLKEGYGVKIAGLGTFTYDLERTLKGSEPGKRCWQLKKVPIMILSEFVVRMYQLISPLHERLSQVPVVSLNLCQVIANTRLPRKIVDGAITEALQAFARAVVCGKNVEFPFPNIGKLQIVDRKVLFKFYAEFCDQLDFHAEPRDADVVADPFILPGVMTPLRRHIPTADFRSVFHLREVRSVHQFDLLAPVKQREDGKFVATSGLDRKIPIHSRHSRSDSERERGKKKLPYTLSPVHIIVENSAHPSRLRKKDGGVASSRLDNFLGSSIYKRYTISWVKGKRDYSNLSQPWPGHHFHVVESASALRRRDSFAPNLPRFEDNGNYADLGTPTKGFDHSSIGSSELSSHS